MHPIVNAARGWIGTRFQHQGRIRKTAEHRGGVDCLGLLVGIAGELGLERRGCRLADLDNLEYGHFPDSARLEAALGEWLERIPAALIQPGDVGLFAVDHHPQHLGIISEYGDALGLIHAYAPARAVVETRLDDLWQHRLHAVFRA